MPEMDVTIFERSQHVLSKVKISGGGRCNCTNTFASVTDLSQVYPRGHRLMRRLFNVFNHRDTISWFNRHNVLLVAQPDGCVFPVSQQSATIVDCLLSAVKRGGVQICTGTKISSLDDLKDYDYVVITTGGSPKMSGLQWLEDAGITLEPPCPSLFTFSIADEALRSLMGMVVNDVSIQIPGTRFRARGPLLITHWGMSGPPVLRLSSYAARHLAETDYQSPVSVNWTGMTDDAIRQELQQLVRNHAQKQVQTIRPFMLPSRLWEYLLRKHGFGQRWGDLSAKAVNRLVNALSNDTYQIDGKSVFKEEFVTCGGVSLKSVDNSTLECRTRPGLYFAGEVLDIDGVTGGFNFQAAWTTAYVVAKSITRGA